MSVKNNGSIILNDDFGHFFGSRYKNNIDVTKKSVEEYIDQYIGTQVTDFCINLNASLSGAPSKVVETIYDKYLQKEVNGKAVDFSNTDLSLAYDTYVNKGLDIFKIMIKRLYDIKINPWISIRMNDLHGFKDIYESRTSNFRSYAVKNGLCRTTHRPHTDYNDKCFNYMEPIVRNRMEEYIDEQINNYNPYGIELDFLRELYCFELGEEEKGREIINEMIRNIKKKNNNLKIMVRVPSNPIYAYDMGYDIYTWAKEEIVDVLIVSPRFTTCDSTMPVESWVKIFDNSSMEIVAGLEGFTNPVPGKIDTNYQNTPEMAIGFGVQYLSAGSNRLYLYNYFDNPTLEGEKDVDTMNFTSKDIVCKTQRGASIQGHCYYDNFLKTIGSLSTSIDLPRRHILTYNDIVPQWVPMTVKLPFRVRKSDYTKVTCKDEYVCMKTGEIKDNKKIFLLVGMENANTGEDLIVWCNNVECKYIRTTKIYPVYTKSIIYVYEINKSSLKKFKQIFEFDSKRETLIVDYIEVRIFNG